MGSSNVQNSMSLMMKFCVEESCSESKVGQGSLMPCNKSRSKYKAKVEPPPMAMHSVSEYKKNWFFVDQWNTCKPRSSSNSSSRSSSTDASSPSSFSSAW